MFPDSALLSCGITEPMTGICWALMPLRGEGLMELAVAPAVDGGSCLCGRPAPKSDVRGAFSSPALMQAESRLEHAKPKASARSVSWVALFMFHPVKMGLYLSILASKRLGTAGRKSAAIEIDSTLLPTSSSSRVRHSVFGGSRNVGRTHADAEKIPRLFEKS